MLSLSLPRRIYDNIRYNRYAQIHLPYDGEFRSRISAAMANKHPVQGEVIVRYRISCQDDDVNCIMGRCIISILSDSDGGCPDDGLPIAVISFM